MQQEILKLGGANALHFSPATPSSRAEICLHGLGEAGVDVNKLLRTGLPAAAKVKEYEHHIYAPQSGSGWWSASQVASFVDAVRDRHSIEEVYILSGYSSGGNGVLNYLTQTIYGHNKVKCFVPMSINSRQFITQVVKCAMRKVLAFHGYKDSIPNVVTESADFITAYNKMYPGFAKRTVFQNLGHNAWDAAYQGRLSEAVVTGDPVLFAPFDKTIYDWAFTDGGSIPQPEIDPIVETYYSEGAIVFKTRGNKTYRVIA
jgi:predicted esterase